MIQTLLAWQPPSPRDRGYGLNGLNEFGSLFFPNLVMRSERKARGIYHELFLCNKGEDTEKGGKTVGFRINFINNFYSVVFIEIF